MEPRILTAEELCAYMNIGRPKLDELRAKRMFPVKPLPLSRNLLFDKKQVDEWLDKIGQKKQAENQDKKSVLRARLKELRNNG